MQDPGTEAEAPAGWNGEALIPRLSAAIRRCAGRDKQLIPGAELQEDVVRRVRFQIDDASAVLGIARVVPEVEALAVGSGAVRLSKQHLRRDACAATRGRPVHPYRLEGRHRVPFIRRIEAWRRYSGRGANGQHESE